MLATSFEKEGYDFMRNGVKAWFAAWGRGAKADWVTREDAGRPPMPGELARAEFIVIGFLRRGGSVDYRTFKGGLDL